MKLLLVSFLAALTTSISFAAAPSIPITHAPVVISNAGEYILTRDLVVTDPGAGVAIDITVSNVVLNLNGFIVRYIAPAGEAPHAGIGIRAPFNSVIQKGRIRGWDIGVLLSGYPESDAVAGAGFVNIVGISECRVGVVANGGTLNHAMARDCTEAGFVVGLSKLTGCIGRGCDVGYIGGESNTFTRCTAFANRGGFDVGGSNLLERCTIKNNSETGVNVDHGAGTEVRRCTVLRNSVIGINVDDEASDVLIDRNIITRNGGATSSVSGAVSTSGLRTTIRNNRFVRNQPNTIDDDGVDSVVIDNVFVPRTL